MKSIKFTKLLFDGLRPSTLIMISTLMLGCGGSSGKKTLSDDADVNTNEPTSGETTSGETTNNTNPPSSVDICQWYNTTFPLCTNSVDSGWGTENGQTCITRQHCENKSVNTQGGIISTPEPTDGNSGSSSSNTGSNTDTSTDNGNPQTGGASSTGSNTSTGNTGTDGSTTGDNTNTGSTSSESSANNTNSSTSTSSSTGSNTDGSTTDSDGVQFRVDATGNITKDGQVLPVRCASWFGLEGQHEPKYAANNPDGAPMELYMGNMWWANGGQGTGRTIQQTMDEITALGINVVRFPIAPQTLDPTDPQGIGFAQNGGVLKNHESVRQNNARQAMEDFIKLADQNNIDLIIDIHSCSNYLGWRAGRLDAKPPYSDANRINYEYTREEHSCSATGNPSSVKYVAAYDESKWLEDLREIASLSEQLGVDNIMAIDIFNEPWDYTWAEWKDLSEKAYATISSVNDEVLIMVEGIAASTSDKVDIPHGDTGTTPNWGENFYPAAESPLDIPKERLIISPHTYGPSVFVQQQFVDQTQPGCEGLEGDEAAAAGCNIVIDSKILKAGWEEHFGFMRDAGFAMIIGEFGGAIDWPQGANNGVNWSHINEPVDEQWQNAFVDYMIEQDIQGCYWSINPESADTGGLYEHAYIKNSNESGWGEWKDFDTRKVNLLKRLWGM